MSRIVVVFEFKNRFIEKFIQQCAINIESSFYPDLLANVSLNTYVNVIAKGIISVTISEAIFISMFYSIIINVYEGKTLINPDEIYRNTAVEPFLDKIAFKEDGVINNVDSDEAYELFDKINEIIQYGIKVIVPVSFVNEFIDHILENKLTIDNLRDNGYYIVINRLTIISYRSISEINSVHTHWNKYSGDISLINSIYTYWHRYNYVY